MTVVTPPRPDGLDERVADLEALIEEARQRARSSGRRTARTAARGGSSISSRGFECSI